MGAGFNRRGGSRRDRNEVARAQRFPNAKIGLLGSLLYGDQSIDWCKDLGFNYLLQVTD